MKIEQTLYNPQNGGTSKAEIDLGELIDQYNLSNRVTVLEAKYLEQVSINQSIIQRIEALEQPHMPSVLKFPTRVTSSVPSENDLPVLGSSGADVVPTVYTPFNLVNGRVKMHYLWGGVPVFSDSPTGLRNTFTPTNLPSGSIPYGPILYVRGEWYALKNQWISGTSYTRFLKSTNGMQFTDLGHTIAGGEDKALLFNDSTQEFFAYVRTVGGGRGPRTISLMKSHDFTSWSPMQLVLEMDADDLAKNHSFYSMPVQKINGVFFGFLNIFDQGSDAGSVRCQLVRSNDGETWTRCANKQFFLPRGPYNQQYAMTPHVMGDKVVIYALESRDRHGLDNGTTFPQTDKFSIGRYEINVTDLMNWS